MICGASFLTEEWRTRGGVRPRGKCCSTECRLIALRRTAKEWKIQNRDRVREYQRNYYKKHNYRWNAEYNRRLIRKGREALGGKCQLCETNENLEFCHIDRVAKYRGPGRGQNVTHMNAAAALKDPSKFLLLCRNCHHYPEPWLKELIELKKHLEPVASLVTTKNGEPS